jgi:hypothetical protein
MVLVAAAVVVVVLLSEFLVVVAVGVCHEKHLCFGSILRAKS